MSRQAMDLLDASASAVTKAAPHIKLQATFVLQPMPTYTWYSQHDFSPFFIEMIRLCIRTSPRSAYQK